MDNIKEIWTSVLLKLKTIINDEGIFNDYIGIIEPISVENNLFSLGVKSTLFTTNWIEKNYKGVISSVIEDVTGSKYEIKLISLESDEEISYTVENDSEKITYNKLNEHRSSNTLNPDFTFDEFVVGSSNSFTHSAARAVTESPGGAYNPLFIYGDTGLGKTHLMQAVGHALLAKGLKIAYITTETLLNEYTEALLNKKTPEFREKYRSLDLLMIDDIQFFAGKKGIQEEFFHTFNALYQDHKQIIITSDRPPAEVSGLESRLVSRFNAGLSVEMESPNFEMRLAILRYKQTHKNIKLTESEEIFIAENVKSNVRTLEGALKRVIAYKNLNPDAMLGIDNIRAILHDLITEESSNTVTVDQIRKVVCEYFDISIEDLNKEGRVQSIVLPRQIAMYLCRVLTENSLPSIAKSFNRTHANIFHACTKMQKAYKTDSVIHDKIITILQKLGKDTSAIPNL